MGTPSALTQYVPWTDKKGRLDAARAVTFALLLLPGVWVALRLGLHMMGARPVNAAIHSTGYWAVSFLVASLMITPAKAIFGIPSLAVLRRMIGNAALGYALCHLLLYCADQNWRMLTVVSEIVLRFYLTIGFVALIGLVVLGSTSTDAAVRRMGARWKRLHRLAYGIAVLALFHFVLQTKADVSLPLLFIGVFFWLMIWRLLPAGRDRTPAPLLLITLGAATLTAAAEWLWYRFGTHIDPSKVLGAELDVSFGLLPTGQVLALGACLIAAFLLRRMSHGRPGTHPAFWVLLFALGAAINELVVFMFGIDRYLDPGDWSFLYQDFAWAALLGVLGFVHWRCRASAERKVVAGLAAACIAFQVVLSSSGMRVAEIVFAVAIVALWAVLAWQTWRETKLAALSLVPLGLVLAYGVASQM